MAEKVDQDVREAAAEAMVLAEMRDLVIGGKMDDHPIVQAFARMKAAGRQQGLREAAEFVRTHVANYSTAKIIRASFPIPSQSSENMAAAITALIEGEGE